MKFIVMILMLIATQAAAATIQLDVNVTSVTDGDTLKGMYYQLPMTFRILGIDTFESRLGVRLDAQAQSHGFVSAEAKEVGLAGKRFAQAMVPIPACVEFSTLNPVDQYGRYLVKMWMTKCVAKATVPSYQEKIVAEGLAMVDYRYKADPFFVNLIAIETVAKTQNKGVWKYTK